MALLAIAGWALPAPANDSGFEAYRKSVEKEIEKHNKTLQKEPANAEAHFQLGLAYQALGRHEEEIAEYKETIRIKPDYADAHFNLAMSYDLLGDGANSIRHMILARQIYFAQRNHGKIRASQRLLRGFYDKYGYDPEDFIRSK